MSIQITQQQENEWRAVAVPLADAQTWVSNWINADPANDPDFKPSDIRAFVVRRSDFVELLDQPDTEYVRLYLGLKPNADTKTGFEPCLVLASAAVKGTTIKHYEGDDKDTIIDLIGEQTVYDMATDNEARGDFRVFDVSRPCPPICDPLSPLFIAAPDGSTC